HANQTRSWRIYADLAQILIRHARQLYAHEEFGLELEQTVYALDSTTIDLCLSLFPWAPWTHGKAAIKLHTLLDLRGSIPTFIEIPPARVSDKQHPGPCGARVRCILYHGPRIHSCSPPLPAHTGRGFLRGPDAEEFAVPAPLLPSSGQKHWLAV